MAVRLEWGNRVSADEIRVYRSTSIFDVTSLPTALATLSASATSYDDESVSSGVEYFYAVGVAKTGSPDLVALSDVVSKTPTGDGATPDPLLLGGVHAAEDGFIFDTVGDDYRIAGATKTLATFFDTYTSDADGEIVVDASGNVSGRTANTPYLVYDKDGNVEGLDCRPEVTNQVQRPTELDNAWWTTQNSSVTANAATSPSGATDADLLTENSSAAFHQIAPTSNFALAKNGTYAVSAFYKPNGRTKVILQINAFSGNYFNAVFDVSAGSYSTNTGGNGTVGTAYMKELPGGWWFLAVTGVPDSANAATGFQMSIALANSAGSGYYTGDGSSGGYIWGVGMATAKTGHGAGAPGFTAGGTTAITETRAVLDVSAASWWDATAGTFLATFKTANLGADSPVLTLWETDFTDRTIIGSGDGSTYRAYAFSEVGNTTQFSLTDGTPPTVPEFVTVAFRYEANNFGLSVDGATTVTDTSGSLPSPTEIIFGGQYSSGQSSLQGSLNGPLQKVVYWPGYAATDEELEDLSLNGV